MKWGYHHLRKHPVGGFFTNPIWKIVRRSQIGSVFYSQEKWWNIKKIWNHHLVESMDGMAKPLRENLSMKIGGDVWLMTFLLFLLVCVRGKLQRNTLTWTWVNLNEQNMALILHCCVFLQFRWLHSAFWKISKWIGQYSFQYFILVNIFSGTKILTLGWHTYI